MTLKELLEHAHLEALGVLEDREQAAFEAAFTVAPPSVQSQVRAEQARVAGGIESLLPMINPPTELRDRVLDAVSAAIVAGNAGQGAEMNLRPSRRVHSAWRAASLGLVSAVVLLGVAFIVVNNANTQMSRQLDNDTASAAFLKEFDRQYMNDVLYNKNTKNVIFTQADEKFNGKMDVWVNPDWPDARLFCQLPSLTGESYRIVIVDQNNQIKQQLQELPGDGRVKSMKVSKIAAGTRLALVKAALNKAPSGDHLLMVATV